MENRQVPPNQIELKIRLPKTKKITIERSLDLGPNKKQETIDTSGAKKILGTFWNDTVILYVPLIKIS